MKAKLLALTWVQITSFVLTFILLLLGVLSAFVPELSVIAENIVVVFGLIGITAAPGIAAQGKQLGEGLKGILPRKVVRQIQAEIKGYLHKKDELAKQYADIIKLAKDIAELGGALTPEQQTAYNTFQTQVKALDKKIDAAKAKLEVEANGKTV